MKPIYIYTLRDPYNVQVRYIGKSVDPKQRFATHLRAKGEDTHTKRWILKLKEAGRVPILVIIEETTEAEWPERERFWIAFYRDLYTDITNTACGGQGFGNIPIEIELDRRKKVSAARRGMKFSDEHRANLSKARVLHFSDTANRDKVSRQNAVLTDEQVLAVWTEANNGETSQAVIGRKYGIPASSVSEIKTGKRYAHVPRPATPISGTLRTRRLVTEAKRLHAEGNNAFKIAKMLGVAHATAQRLIAS